MYRIMSALVEATPPLIGGPGSRTALRLLCQEQVQESSGVIESATVVEQLCLAKLYGGSKFFSRQEAGSPVVLTAVSIQEDQTWCFLHVEDLRKGVRDCRAELKGPRSSR